jgi:hypothetical protein
VRFLIWTAVVLPLRMIQYVWASKGHEEGVTTRQHPSGSAYSESGVDNASFLTGAATVMTEKGAPSFELRNEEELLGVGGWIDQARGTRPVVLFAPLITGLAIILNAVFVGSGIRSSQRAAPVCPGPDILTRCLSSRSACDRVHAGRALLSNGTPRHDAVHYSSRSSAYAGPAALLLSN